MLIELSKSEVVKQLAERGTDIAEAEVQVVTIRVKKGSVAKGEQMLMEVTPDLLSNEEIAIIWQLGLEARMNNTGFSKVEKGDVEEAKRVAQDNAQKLYDGKLRAPVGLSGMKKKAKGPSDKSIQSEARKLAREEIKDRIRSAGEKVTHYAAKDINKAADGILADDDEVSQALWAEAEKIVNDRAKAREKASTISAKKGKAIELIKGMKKDPELVKKATQASAAKKAKAAEKRASAN